MGITDFERIAAQIVSEDSPVGIDAKKTHVMILLALERLEKRLAKIEQQLADRDPAPTPPAEPAT